MNLDLTRSLIGDRHRLLAALARPRPRRKAAGARKEG